MSQQQSHELIRNSDTPLTDEAAYVPDMTATEQVVSVEFARALERKLAVCRTALGIRRHEKIPEQNAQAGSLLVDDGSTRRRVYGLESPHPAMEVTQS